MPIELAAQSGEIVSIFRIENMTRLFDSEGQPVYLI